MFKKVFLLTIFPCFCLSVLSQINYIESHRQTHKAEIFIANQQFDSALVIYEEVFAQLPHAFYRDLHNAAVCYLKLGDFEKGYELINQLVLHGYELIDFESGSFDILKTNKIYWQRFLKQYPSLRASFLKSRPEPLFQEYYQLFLSDQNAASGWDINFQDSVFYSQAGDLFRLVDLHGFLPIDVNKDTIRTQIFIQFRHLGGLLNRYKNDPETFDDAFFSEMESYTIKFDSLLLQALQSGKILPQTYADIVSYWASPNPYGDIAMKIDLIAETVGFKINLTLEQIKEVNERRSEIGLYPFSLMSDGIFQSTWYRHYPFKEMKKAYLNCDSCATSLDYDRVRRALETKVKDQFSTEERKEFILTDVAFIRDIWLYGFNEFEINLH
jgi:hypothetical protein